MLFLKANIDNLEIKFLDFELKSGVTDLKSRIRVLKSLRFISSIADDIFLDEDIIKAKKILFNRPNYDKM
ncbi:hypothetical protein [Mycoplasmopsis bovis]|uniref:hypothetical protein n=1 Tax=Mycoplasmopsis bovis TaxID=28903 RepID=UPI00260938EA|nr:hypothetical protein [Mycoplasmopsis bovis]